MSMERSMAGPAAEPTPPGVMPGVGGSAPPGDDAHTREAVPGGDGTPRAAPSGGAPTQAMGHATQADGGATTALRLQILSSEHWSLLATRSLAWNESFTRAGMFLTALSGAIVALALVAQASDFGPGFVIFALVILPVVLFIGLTTYARLGAANSNEAICVIGMNRIRAAYLQFAPDLEPYFVMGAHDDARGVGVTMGVDPRASQVVHLVAATPTMVATLNAVILAVLASIVALQVQPDVWVAVAVGIAFGAVAMLGHLAYARRTIGRARGAIRPRFPSPPQA